MVHGNSNSACFPVKQNCCVPRYSRDQCCCVTYGAWLMNEEVDLYAPLWIRVCSPFAESICVAMAIFVSVQSLIVGFLVDLFLRNV